MFGAILLLALLVFAVQALFGKAKMKNFGIFVAILIFGPMILSLANSQLNLALEQLPVVPKIAFILILVGVAVIALPARVKRRLFTALRSGLTRLYRAIWPRAHP